MTGRTQLSVDLIAKVGGFEAGMKRAANAAGETASRIRTKLGEIGPGMAAGLAAGATAAAGGLAFALKGAIDRADQLAEASDRLGLTTEQFTAMGFAAKFSGIESAKFEAAIRSFNSRIEKTEPLLNALGVATRDVATNAFLPSTDIIRSLGDTFAALPPGIEESQLAAELFGTRLGGQMIPLLNRGTQGIRDMEDRAHSLGGVLRTESAAAAGAFSDELDELQFVMNGALLDLIPQATKALRGFGDLVKDPSFLEGIGALVGVLARTAHGFGLIVSESTKALGTMKRFATDDTDTQLDRRLAALQTRISAARQVSGGELPANFEITMPDVARAMKEREAIIREQRRRILSARQGQPAPAAGVAPAAGLAGGTDPLAALRAAFAEKERRTKAAAKSRDAAAAAAKRQAEAERELGQPVEKEARRMEGARKRQAAIEADLLERVRQEDEARQPALESGRALVKSLEFELALMKMSNEERATAIQLRSLDSEAVAKYGAQIADLNRQIEDQLKVQQFSDNLRRGFEDTFASIIDGTKSAKDAFADLGSYITSMIAQRLGAQLVDSLLGPSGTPLGGGGGGIGGLLSGFLGSLFGGGRAAGGWVSPGKMYEVAENGPELLRVGNRQFLLPSATGGMVTPNARMGGGGGVVQHITVQGRIDNRTSAQLARETARAQARAAARFGA